MSEDQTEETKDFSSQASLETAFKEKLRVVIPKSTELFIDIDSDADYAQFNEAYSRLKLYGFFPPLYRTENVSRNGLPGRHITVTLRTDVSPLERVALQAILGSDWKRELYSLFRIKQEEPLPTLFFEKE